MTQCPASYQWSKDEKKCVAVTCKTATCVKGSRCVPMRVLCIQAPCRQFECVPTVQCLGRTKKGTRCRNKITGGELCHCHRVINNIELITKRKKK